MYRSYNRIPQSKSMHIMLRGYIVTDHLHFVQLFRHTYPRISEGSTFDLDSSSVVKSLWLFVFRSNPVFKVYQHRSRNGNLIDGELEKDH